MPASIPPGDPSLRGGQNTFASNPALLKLNIGAWLAANPAVIAITGGVALAGLVVLFIKVPPGIALLVTAGIVFYQSVREAKQKFFMGDVCCGVVLSAQENLVAVFTDLKAGGNLERPAIKILKQPLNRLTIEPAYDGMRVAAAALYHGNVRSAAWQNFSPEVIHCVEPNPEEIARVLASISEAEWQALDGWLAHLPNAKPGLYRLWEMNFSAPTEAAAELAPSQPWFKTKPAIIGLSILGVLVALFIGVLALGAIGRGLAHRRAFNPPTHFSTPSASAPKSWEPTQTGPFVVGGTVEADWAGRWIPGKITKINGGGFSVMVQLEDSHWPMPLVLSTNQLRLK